MSAKEKVNAFLTKLPFKGMMEKIPAETRAKVPGLDKIIPFTNHIVCGFIVILLLLIISGFSGGDGGEIRRETTAAKSKNTKNIDTSDLFSAVKQTANDIKDTAGSNKTASKGSAFSRSPGKANPDKDFEYRLNKDGDKVIISKYIGSSGTVVIPLTIEGMPVARLDPEQDVKSTGGGLLGVAKLVAKGGEDGIFKNAVNVYVPDGIDIWPRVFRDCKRLKEVRLPDDLEYIGEGLFDGCGQLETVSIPSALKSIGAWAFKKCKKLTRIDLPDNIGIGSYAFEESGIKQIRWPVSSEAIRMGTFKKSALESIIIPEGVERIDGRAFEECTKLTSVSLPSTIKYIGWTANADDLAGAILSARDGSAFRKCKNLTTLNIPDSVSEINLYGLYNFTETNLPLKTQARLKQLGYTDSF